MQRPDIIRRAFRGTRVGIDIDGKMKNFLRFPGFETYVPPEKEEDHIDELLTEKEILKLEKEEMKNRERQKKRKSRNARKREQKIFRIKLKI